MLAFIKRNKELRRSEGSQLALDWNDTIESRRCMKDVFLIAPRSNPKLPDAYVNRPESPVRYLVRCHCRVDGDQFRQIENVFRDEVERTCWVGRLLSMLRTVYSITVSSNLERGTIRKKLKTNKKHSISDRIIQTTFSNSASINVTDKEELKTVDPIPSCVIQQLIRMSINYSVSTIWPILSAVSRSCTPSVRNRCEDKISQP